MQENKLAQLITTRIPSIEKIRMVNSGTEATMSAIRLARGFTGKNIIVKFEGNYHGHSDHLLVKAGSGIATLGLPDCPGVPLEITKTRYPFRITILKHLVVYFIHMVQKLQR